MLQRSAKSGERHSGRGGQNTGSQNGTPKLSDLGVSKQQSSRWQKLAEMPDDQFEAAIETAKEVAGEVTTAAMLRAATPAARPACALAGCLLLSRILAR
jgi:hypothetical protein